MGLCLELNGEPGYGRQDGEPSRKTEDSFRPSFDAHPAAVRDFFGEPAFSSSVGIVEDDYGAFVDESGKHAQDTGAADAATSDGARNARESQGGLRS